MDFTFTPSNNHERGGATEGSLDGKFSSILNGKGLFATIGNDSHHRAGRVGAHAASGEFIALVETVQTSLVVDKGESLWSVHVGTVANLAVSVVWSGCWSRSWKCRC